MRSIKHITVSILLLVLCATSCKTTKLTQKHESEATTVRTDSVSLLIERIARPIVIPMQTVQLKLHPDSLLKLPIGAVFSKTEGHATATVMKEESGYSFTANCDSLILIVEDLRTEIYHLNNENTVFREQLNSEKTIEVNRLTSWQSFQIWTGRICLALLLCLLIYRIIKIKFLKT